MDGVFGKDRPMSDNRKDVLRQCAVNMSGGTELVREKERDKLSSGVGTVEVPPDPGGPGPPGFWAILTEEIKSRGLNVTESCLASLHDLTQRAEGIVGADPDGRGEAEADLVRFVDRLVAIAGERNSTSVDDESLNDAVQACHLWPWCTLDRGNRREKPA